MTTFFDRYTTRRHDLEPALDGADPGPAAAELDAIEREMVEAVSAAAMLPAFPADLRRSVLLCVLRDGVAVREPSLPPFPPADLAERCRRLADLTWNLHSTFHAVGQSGPDQTDDPTAWMRDLGERASDARLALYATDPGALDAPDPDTLPPAQGPQGALDEARLAALLARFAEGDFVGEALLALEASVVATASAAVMLPGTPPTLAEAVHRAVLGGSVTSRERELPEVDFEEDTAWIGRLRGMVRRLDAAFRAAGFADVRGPLDRLLAEASAARLALYAADPREATPTSRRMFPLSPESP